MQISYYLQSHPNTSCTVYHMSKGEPRERSLNGNGEIPQPKLFQGKNPTTGKVIYPGDRLIRGEGVTVQIHNLAIILENEKVFVPAIAVWLPKDVSPDVLVQNQGGDEVGD